MASLRTVPIASLDDAPLDRQSLDQSDSPPLRVLIAGGGLGGLALASTLTQLGTMDVHVLEQATQYKPFGGPIQIQSNALWALQRIRPILYDAIEEAGVRTGDRLSGIKDGLRYQEGWLVKFDAATPALQSGLPLTLAINRVVLQDIFLKYGIAEERVHTKSFDFVMVETDTSHTTSQFFQNNGAVMLDRFLDQLLDRNGSFPIEHIRWQSFGAYFLAINGVNSLFFNFVALKIRHGLGLNSLDIQILDGEEENFVSLPGAESVGGFLLLYRCLFLSTCSK